MESEEAEKEDFVGTYRRFNTKDLLGGRKI